MTGFEDLDDDVLYMILDYLYLERAEILRSLRLTCSRLKDFSDAVAHRTVSLIDDDVHEQITYRLTERLTDPSDKICHYVREFRVANFKGDADSCCLNSALISDCLGSIRRLEAFSWTGDAPIPSRLLDDLQQRFPTAQLCVSSTMGDHNLLPILQLHRLDVSVPCAKLVGEYNISMFEALKQALLRLANLRHLSIDTHHDPDVGHRDDAALDRLQLPLKHGDKLPSLESLDIRSTTYAYDVDHCTILLAAMDFSKLQRLRIGSNNPVWLFKKFHQHLPRLSHLDISYASNRDDPRDLNLAACTNFARSLETLKSLVLRFDDLNMRSSFFKMLTDVHGSRLLYLSLQARQKYYQGPACHGNMRRFLWAFSKLRSLSMTFPNIRSYHRCPDCEDYEWGDPNYFSFVPPLPSLRDVQLSIPAPYGERPLYASINKHAHCAIRHLWTTFVEQNDSQLETLSIHFWRWATNGRQTRRQEVIYDTTWLRGQLFVKVRHNRNVPVVVYKDAWESRTDRMVLVAAGV